MSEQQFEQFLFLIKLLSTLVESSNCSTQVTVPLSRISQHSQLGKILFYQTSVTLPHRSPPPAHPDPSEGRGRAIADTNCAAQSHVGANSSVARHSRPPSRSAAAIFYDSRAADANEVLNRAVRSADYVSYGLNSLFREIEFPVRRIRIPCSTKLNSLFRRKKFPVNLTGDWPENA
jgi:hypothetical protein